MKTEAKENGQGGGKVVELAKDALKDKLVLSRLEDELAKVLVSLQKNPKWDKYVAKRWESFPEEQKSKIYLEGKPTKQMMMNALFMSNPALIYLVKGREFIEAPTWRWLVQAGLVDKPESVTEDQMKQDLQKDGKVFERMLYVIEAILAVFAPEAIPELATAKTIIIQIMDVRKRVAEKTKCMDVLQDEAVAA